MAKLTKIQLTTFIDIISQDNYRAPLYCSSIEQGIERKGLISLHKDRSVRLTKAGEQLANEINKRRETQDLAHMSIDERQLFLSNIAEQGLKDEAVIQLSKDRNAELRLRGVRLLIKRGLLDQKQATKFAHDKSSEIRALMVGKADLMEFSDILPRLMRGGGFLLKNPNGFSIDRLSPHALWFARCFTSRAVRRFFWLRPGCSGRRSRPGHAEPRTAGTSIP